MSEDLMSLIDAYAESRHVNGHRTYSQKTAEARKAVVDAISCLGSESATGQKTLAIKLLREALKSIPGGTAAIGRVAISNPAYAVILQQAFAGDSIDTNP